MLKPTPLFEGSLDMPVFGAGELRTSRNGQRLWGATRGSRSQRANCTGSKGTRLLVLPTPASANEDAIGVLEVASNDQLRSKLTASSNPDDPQLELSDVPAGAYVRLAEQAYPFELIVAKPDPATTLGH